MDAFGGLADPVRRGLLRQVAQRPARVVDLAAQHAISRPAISRHLRVLTEAGLVEAEEVGRERHYRLRPEGLAEVSAYVAALRATPPVPESAFDALDLEVRRTTRERHTARPGPPAADRAAHRPSDEETA